MVIKVGTFGNDLLIGSAAADTLLGSFGNDELRGSTVGSVSMAFHALLQPRRRASRHLAVFAAALCTSAAALPAAAATFQVNATVDAVDATPGNGVCATAAAKCTLRAAIQEANALPGLDTVKVPAGVYRLTRLGKAEALGATGDLNIRRSMRLEGAGPSRTFIQGTVCADPDDPDCSSEDVPGDTDRVLSIVSAGSNPVVDISGVTIQNGG
jgi:CSLREA domain-containing protein